VNFDELVALGGLFHDVGKPVQRAGLYSGDHSTQGARFLRDLARKTGRAEFELLALFSEFHHANRMNEENMRKRIREVSPGKFGLTEEDILNALWIVYEADNLSSKERDNLEKEKGQLYNLRPLSSVFNPDMKYALEELSLSESMKLPMPEENITLAKESYRDIVEKFRGELEGTPLRMDRLLPLFERYFTFVSSFTMENNVISLYDHMRMTSAIALAMAKAGCTAGDVKKGRCRNEKKFLLIEGDFSGIQDFIYGVSGKGTLKYLRARSSYLELIGWDVVLEILERLGLTRANVVFNAGGHFLIIAQNTKEAVEELEDIRKHTAEWLYREFDGKLYLAIEWEPICGVEFGRERSGNLNYFKEARKRLKRKLTVRKLRRFGEVDYLFKHPEGNERLDECAVCHKEVPERKLEKFVLSDDPNVKACETCNRLALLGEKLPKVKGFGLAKSSYEDESITFGPYRAFVPWFENFSLPQAEYLLVKNSLRVPEDVPEGTIFIPYLVADYYKSSEKSGDKKDVATFEELAEASLGAKRLGVLKGDVDKLGEFFGNLDSPSKLATASRFMDYFFKVYLKDIIKGKFEDVAGKPLVSGRWSNEPDIVVVYAGGDDFFLVGSWNHVFDVAFKIRNAFNAYTGGKLTISAGLGYFNYKTPIYRMAEVVRERLEIAKDEGKNRVFIVERSRPRDKKHRLSYEWEHYKELWERYAKKIYSGSGRLKKELEPKKGLLWKLLQMRELYVRDPDDIRWAYLTAYLLGRHSLAEIFPELGSIDANALEKGEPQPIYWLDGVLKIVLMAVRG